MLEMLRSHIPRSARVRREMREMRGSVERALLPQKEVDDLDVGDFVATVTERQRAHLALFNQSGDRASVDLKASRQLCRGEGAAMWNVEVVGRQEDASGDRLER
jgi:hypothetical protein